MPVAFGNIVNLLVGEALFAHYYGVNTVVCSRVVGNYHIRGHISHYTASAFNQHPVANLAAFMQNYI